MSTASTPSCATPGAAGVDGLIVVDLPPEEDEELCLPALAGGPELHPPGDADDRRRAPAGGARQYFRLCLLCLDHGRHRARRPRTIPRSARRRCANQGAYPLPVAVGFGVKDAAAAAAKSRAHADAVVVGSALVDALATRSTREAARTVAAVDRRHASSSANWPRGVRATGRRRATRRPMKDAP